MGGINWTRVVLGGFVSGVVINVGEFILNGVVLSKDWAAAMAALGRPPMSPGQVAVLAFWSFVIWGLFVGVFSVWLYAAIRSHYGTGLKTALRAAFVVWALGYVLGAAGPAVMHIFPLRLIFIGLVVGLMEVLVSVPLGAWLYRQQPAA